MEREMDKEKNLMNIMANYYLKEIIYITPEEKEKNMIQMEN